MDKTDIERRSRVLIIEDEPLIAFTLEDILGDAGFEVAGIAGTLVDALKKIASDTFDIATVDANLAGVSAGPAAAELRTRGIPFIVLSGYSADQLRAIFPGAVFLRKPCQAADLVRSLQTMLAQQYS